jgi:hypothetical protein
MVLEAPKNGVSTSLRRDLSLPAGRQAPQADPDVNKVYRAPNLLYILSLCALVSYNILSPCVHESGRF